MTRGGGAVENQISPSCTTGNCTFPNGDPFENGTLSANTFSSIGMSSKCVDVSSLVVSNTAAYLEYTFTLPNGLSIIFSNWGPFVK
jgi:hypothetical protein